MSSYQMSSLNDQQLKQQQPPVPEPPPGYPRAEDSAQPAQAQGPIHTQQRADGFWKGCCAALCCCCALDICL